MGLHPRTGEQLTAMLVDDRMPGWDFTASLPKGVTAAMEAATDASCRWCGRWPMRRWPMSSKWR